MYKFVDTIEKTKDTSLPAEALSINGEYIENQVPGYRTLYVSGREIIENELFTYEAGTSDGSKYQGKRYPGRTIVVGYQLIANTSEAFRNSFNELNRVLSTEQAQLIFADEQDKFFIGTKEGMSGVSPGTNSVIGEIEFYCAEPFKYSIDEKIVDATVDDDTTMVLDYVGTYKSYPVLEAKTTYDAGYIGYINQQGHIIQIGDAEEFDAEHYLASEMLINDQFTSYSGSGWRANVAITTPFTTTSGAVINSIQVGTMKNIDDMRGDSILGADYGSGASWHGPSITKDIPEDSNGVSGSKNGTFSWRHIYEIGASSDLGFAQFLMTGKKADGTKINIAGINFAKGGDGIKERAHIYVNGRYKTDISVNADKNNIVTGYSTGRSSIAKFGGKFTFSLCGKIYEFEDPAMEEVKVTEISIYLGKYGAQSPIALNGVYSVRFVSHSVDSWRKVPNKFCTGDDVKVNCKTGEIWVNSEPMPGLGALGNDWEEFYLRPGVNQIKCTCSTWSQKPTFKLRYREVYL